MILRIIDKETKLFIRDDFHYNSETEIALTAPPSMGLFKPKWNGVAWEEGATQEYIDSLKADPQLEEPTESERIEALEQALLEIVLGGVF